MEDDIKKRLYNVIETSSLHMIEFLKLLDIEYSSSIDTAAITCDLRPKLLLNKEFINKYCKTDEHLFMLVMHELYHIILGHTKLFSNHTLIDNIAFDAIINAILCRNFNKEEYTSFFTNLNTDKEFPSCLLRPIGKNTPNKYLRVLKNLYLDNKGTYYEIYEVIIKELIDNNNGNFILLGNHNGGSSINNSIIKKMVEDIISKWPRELEVSGRDEGGKLESKEVKLLNKDKIIVNKFKRLLRKTIDIDKYFNNYKKDMNMNYETGLSFIPNYKDRTYLVKKIVYNDVLTYNNKFYKPILDIKDKQSFVYLDVSGSVIDELNKLIPILLKPCKNKEIIVFQFSTIVKEMNYKDLKKGKYESTSGTDINSVFKHFYSLKKRPKKMLILTDGYVGSIYEKYKNLIKENKTKIFVGYFCNYTKSNLENITTYSEVLE